MRFHHLNILKLKDLHLNDYQWLGVFQGFQAKVTPLLDRGDRMNPWHTPASSYKLVHNHSSINYSLDIATVGSSGLASPDNATVLATGCAVVFATVSSPPRAEAASA